MYDYFGPEASERLSGFLGIAHSYCLTGVVCRLHLVLGQAIDSARLHAPKLLPAVTGAWLAGVPYSTMPLALHVEQF